MLKHAGTCVRELFQDTLFDEPVSAGAADEGQQGLNSAAPQARKSRSGYIALEPARSSCAGLPHQETATGRRLKYSRRERPLLPRNCGIPRLRCSVRTRQAGAPLARNGSGPTTSHPVASADLAARQRFWSSGGCPPTALITGGLQRWLPAGLCQHDFLRHEKTSFREQEVWDCSRGHFFDQIRLWFPKGESQTRGKSRRNTVTLAPALLGGTEETTRYTGGHRSGARAG